MIVVVGNRAFHLNNAWPLSLPFHRLITSVMSFDRIESFVAIVPIPFVIVVVVSVQGIKNGLTNRPMSSHPY